MRYIEGSHNGRSAIIRVAIIDAAKYREHKQSQQPVLTGVRPYNALIDTGATSTMISSRVTREMNLEPVTKKQFNSLNGVLWTFTYLFHVAFYDATYKSGLHNDDGDQHSLEQDVAQIDKTHVYTQPVTGGEVDGSLAFDVLLGMDIITTGCLTIRRDGLFSFDFE